MNAQAVADGGRILVAWDDVTERSVIYWGTLDPTAGVLERRVAGEDVAYPVIANAGRSALVVGAHNAKTLFIRTLKLRTG